MTKARIAVVDDEKEILELYTELLGVEYDVIPFSDPQVFLKTLQDPSFPAPALLISDFKMPGMTGIQLMRQIQEKGMELPTILFTGYLDVETSVQAVDLGVFRILQKPVSKAKI